MGFDLQGEPRGSLLPVVDRGEAQGHEEEVLRGDLSGLPSPRHDLLPGLLRERKNVLEGS